MSNHHRQREWYSDANQQKLREARQQWDWSEWLLGKLRVEGGSPAKTITDEEILAWHHQLTIR